MNLPAENSSFSSNLSGAESSLNSSKALRSHYQFKNWIWENGERTAAVPVTPVHRALPHLISTAVFNPRRNSQTVLTLTIDIDFKRCDSDWISGNKVDLEKVKDFLWENHTPIYMAIDAIVQSTSGKGFHLIFGIQPIEVGGLSRQVYYRWRLESVQKRLISLLSEAGIGADPAAIGAVRDLPNYLDPKKLLYGSAEWVLRSQSYKEADKILELDEYLEQSGYPRKEIVEKPFGELRVARSVAKLYCFLADALLDGEGVQTVQLKELCELSGCCEPFLRKFLSAPPTWLSSSFCGKAEGWKISLKDGLALFEKARVAAESQSESKKSSKPFILCPPEGVKDGERNSWIKGVAVWLKHSGIEEQSARTQIASLVRRIPGFERSRNCRAYLSIVKSIYGSRKFKDLFGCRAGQNLPDWLIGGNFRENVISAIEGDVVPLYSQRGGDTCSGPVALAAVRDEKQESQKTVLDMVNSRGIEKNTSEQERQGDLPPHSENDNLRKRPRSGFQGYASQKSDVNDENQNVLKIEAFKNDCLRPQSEQDEPKVFRTIRACRGEICRDRHPVDRLMKACDRLKARASEEEILAVLFCEHERLKATKDRGIRYHPPSGLFKRLSEAWSFLSASIRADFITSTLEC